jgi:hypothetical protein
LDKKQHLVIVIPNNARRAPRLRSEYDLFKSKYDITIVGDEKPSYIEEEHFISMGVLKLKEKYFPSRNKIQSKLINQKIKAKSQSWSKKSQYNLWCFKESFLFHDYLLSMLLNSLSFDLLLIHHVKLLPLTSCLESKDHKLIANLHEYYPKEEDHLNDWKIKEDEINRVCQEFLPKCDLILCVNQSIADQFVDIFSLEKNKVLDFSNKKPYFDKPPSKTCSKKMRLIHHGVAIAERNIEGMIHMMDALPKHFELHLMILPGKDQSYYNKLRLLESDRVIFDDVVDSEDIIAHISQYDIGLYLLPDINYNHRLALPNKFFEFVQAKLCLAISPSTEMKRICEKYNLGVISDDFSYVSLAKKIEVLTSEDVDFYKNQAKKASYELSSEKGIEMCKERITLLL